MFSIFSYLSFRNFSFLLFSIYWCVLDGADCNRQFIKIHFKDNDPALKHFVTRNPYTGEEMVFIMDCKVIGIE